MEYVEIKKVGKVVTGNTPSKKENKYYNQNYIEFVKPSNFISGKITNIKKGEEYLSYEGMKKGRTANKGDVLVTCIGNIGNVGIVEKKVCFNQQINAIKCNENYINNKYLANVIRYISPLLTHMANKAVVPILNKTQLENVKIPIFPKETQEEIANILEIIQKNIDKRREQLLLADELIKSRFIEMFGDPIRNEKGWEVKKLGEILNIERGSSPRPINKYITDSLDGINWIKISDTNLNSYYISLTKEKIIREGIKKSRYVKKGDLILSNSMSFGRPYILKVDGCIHDGWLVLRNEKKLFENLFLCIGLGMESVYKYFTSIVVGGVVNNLNKEMVKSLEFIVPPFLMQNEFAEFVTKIDKLKFEAEKSLKEMENLYESLMQKFFKQN